MIYYPALVHGQWLGTSDLIPRKYIITITILIIIYTLCCLSFPLLLTVLSYCFQVLELDFSSYHVKKPQTENLLHSWLYFLICFCIWRQYGLKQLCYDDHAHYEFSNRSMHPNGKTKRYQYCLDLQWSGKSPITSYLWHIWGILDVLHQKYTKQTMKH